MIRYLLALALPVLLLQGCAATVGVDESSFESVYREYRENVLDDGTVSVGTQSFLAYFGLEKRYEDNPAQVIAELEVMNRQERRRSFELAVAELSYAQALEDDDRGRFLASAIHAYLYLFGEGYHESPNPYSPRFRLACDLYNRGLARSMRDESGAIVLKSGEFSTPAGKIQIDSSRPGFPWGKDVFDTFLPADAFKVRGLRERVRDSGLGVPLIAVKTEVSEVGLSAKNARRGIKLPATAFLRINGGLDDYLDGALEASLELYLGSDVPSVRIAGQRVPLEADLTVALAHSLEDSQINDFGLEGFRRGITKDFPTGVFLLQPYQKGKIPLVLIHGTASSPATWAQTVNGILADRLLRSRYQIWLAMYNTGNPVVYSASLLRESLVDLHASLDPEGDDPSLSNMVVVGHSQGGLVTRLLLSESGDQIWSSISEVPFEEYELEEGTRELLRKALFFEPIAFAKRAVFISTPHRGSFVAGGWLGSIASKLVELPGNLTDIATSVFEKTKLPKELRRLPTSVDNMKPDNLFVKNLSKLPMARDVHLHSIIAVEPGKGPIEEGDDGVVKYTSAHLDEADSEFVVRHGHSCQDQPATIGELRRILFLHLGQ